MINASKIRFEGITKRYHEVLALADVNIEINDGEFFVIFGPSGAGKTTALKLIPGLELPSSGKVFLKNENVNSVQPQARKIRMAFENYSLYPHLSVYENIASPLKAIRTNKKTVDDRVFEIARMLEIEPYLNRLPQELSGGQKQRVSLGRALSLESDIILLDEPLAHLDAKIRSELRLEFHRIKAILKSSTVIYVTHDYLEALSLGDRVCVLNEGKVEQIDSPRNIYEKPRNIFVSKVFGYPQINLFTLNIKKGNELTLFNDDFSIGLSSKNQILQLLDQNEIVFGCRPQFWDFCLKPVEGDKECIKGIVENFEIRNYQGVITVRVENSTIIVLCQNYESISQNQPIWIKPRMEKILLFDTKTGDNVGRN